MTERDFHDKKESPGKKLHCNEELNREPPDCEADANPLDQKRDQHMLSEVKVSVYEPVQFGDAHNLFGDLRMEFGSCAHVKSTFRKLCTRQK